MSSFYPALHFHPQILLDQIVILILQAIVQFVIVVAFLPFLRIPRRVGVFPIASIVLLDGVVVYQVLQLLTQAILVICKATSTNNALGISE